MSIRSAVIRLLRYLLFHLDKRPKLKIELQNWFTDEGDKTHRLNYDIDFKSIVFDLGGYEGQWASDIYCKYKCKLFVFEPSKTFYAKLRRKFEPNSDVNIFPFGLADRSRDEKLFMQRDGSSIHVNKSSGTHEIIQLVAADDFIRQQNIQKIDLMKINIEGGEYDLLDHLISSGQVNKIKNIQVQFHDFIPDAEGRMVDIQTRLSKTHVLTYQYRFVWENWSLIER